ncbi:enoyl-CoA hydratase-related protein [Jiangella anatolica]|uniref:1,4-dihydroxy-2-naphthoyl-CoA synthase n=1 Tax=Jiangella anatolica TaxID=2670374 RepID=A0A2W2C561_9ACTN|nr:enoyl-CoA hydratase-related protein [Jiangella anatolica]PZF83349.1 1,4-dihydroxy-2-naphthoyl-CoA synthase [Jiangella anatolica]
MSDYTDIRYERRDAAAIVTIDRPEVMNAFRAETVDELVHALRAAAADRTVAAVVITGAGEKAFCTGGDLSTKTDAGYAGPHATGIDIDTFNYTVRSLPKPVIAAVNGYAIGGGNVLQVVCDLTIAAEHAVFGQVGPRVGSVDPGFGTSYLARLVGEKKARELWFLCRRYSAAEALAMGLVNAVVPGEELMAEALRWCAEIAALSPTALRLAKQSFAVDTEMIAAMSRFAVSTVDLFYRTAEAEEGYRAFRDRRAPDFTDYR